MVVGTLGNETWLAMLATPQVPRLRTAPGFEGAAHDPTAGPAHAHPLRPDASEPGRRSVRRFRVGDGEFATDARVAVLRFAESGDPSALDLIDATVAVWTGMGAFEIPLGQARDLYLDSSSLQQARGAASGTKSTAASS